ncbi:TPA: hypothetical protein QCX35_003862, partial [Bacillus toyonensis]|nr:hypothetical protein [Bacillus toyonensis]
EVSSIIHIDVALEVLSRIYFALSVETQKEMDNEVLKFLNRKENYEVNDNKILVKLIKRIFFAKNREQSKAFGEKLISTEIKTQSYADKSEYQNKFFEPLLEILDEKKDILNLEVPEEHLELLLKMLHDEADYSIRESALIRLTYLALTESLPERYYSQFISKIQKLSKGRKYGISDFIFSNTFDRIIYSNEVSSEEEQEEFLKKNIPQFYSKDRLTYDLGVNHYFQELKGIFIDYIGSKGKRIPESKVYKQWLEKFYVWWESQKEGLLRKGATRDSVFRDQEIYLISVIIALKNNIWGTIPKGYLDENDRNKANQIFCEIHEKRPDLSIYLVPCLQRLSININYSIEEILNGLWDSDFSKVKASTEILTDYLIFIDKGEIAEGAKVIKRELFNMMRYGTNKVRQITIKSIYYTLKNTSVIFEEKDYKMIIQYVNSFLEGINKGHIEVLTQEDFELLSSISGMVAYICKNKINVVGNSLDEWKDYIRLHRLPEVKTYADLFDNPIDA